MSINIDLRQSARTTLELAVEDGLPASVLARVTAAAVRVVWVHGQDKPFVVVKQEVNLYTNVAFFGDLDDAIDCMEAVAAGEWNEHEQTWLATWWDTYVAEAGHPAQIAGVA